MVTDAIIIGAYHKKVQKRLLNEGDNQAIHSARQVERSQLQVREVRGQDTKVASNNRPRSRQRPKKDATPG